MKNFLVALSILIMLITFTAQSTFAASPTQPITAPSTQPCPLTGDTNACDGKVNALDFTYLSLKFGSTESKADLNGDKKIDALDFTILSQNYGK